MWKSQRFVWLIAGMIGMVLVGCSLGGIMQAAPTPTPTQVVVPTPSHTLAPPFPQRRPPTATAESTSEAVEIEHAIWPGEPPRASLSMWDYQTGKFVQPGNPVIPPGGDVYDINLYERPFSWGGQDIYFPELDIVRASLSWDDTWFYVTIDLYGPPDSNTEQFPYYGVELDTNLDGRGDVLIWVEAPYDTEWSTNGVSVLLDSDGDVGDKRPCRSDAPIDLTTHNGFDEEVFFWGMGSDPDLAWSRWQKNSTQVQVAFKRAFIQAGAFMWWVWSQHSAAPELMDYNDFLPVEEAGVPYPNSPYYPVQGIAEVDNTCRWVYGVEPSSKLPCMCEQPKPTPKPEQCKQKPLPYDNCSLDGNVWYCTQVGEITCSWACTWNPKTCDWDCQSTGCY